MLLFAAIALTIPATAQNTVNPKGDVFYAGTSNDTAFGNSTKHQIAQVSRGGGLTVSYYIDQINDSCAGYVSVWGSTDGVDYFPYPGADSVAITVGVDFKKGWFLSTFATKNPVKFLDVRTRLTSTYTVGKAKVRTRVYPY